eukprot:15438680-Alexandrium_andersonii.AAC.1
MPARPRASRMLAQTRRHPGMRAGSRTGGRAQERGHPGRSGRSASPSRHAAGAAPPSGPVL